MEAMPFTYGLSQDSTNIFIPNIEEAIGVGRSMDGQILTLSGLHPNKNQFTFAFFEQEYIFPSIVKSLNTKTNYKSILSTVSDTTLWKQHIAAKSMGIEELYGAEKKNNTIKDKVLFSKVIKDIDNLDKEVPLFYAIITGDSHPPFDPDGKPIYHLPSELNKDRRGYYIALQHTDREIANLFSYLRDKQTLKQTTIVIIADHCVSDIHSGGCKPVMPLLIVNPVNNPKYRPKNNPSQVSVFPTIMHAMGIVDSTYMGLTPSMLSPRIDSLTESDFRKIEEVSMAIIYYDKSK